MLQGLLGLIVAAVLTALLAYQARQAAPGSRLRQTYSLAAGGFGLIIAANALWLLGLGGGLLGSTVGLVAVALLIAAAAAFLTALFNGEFREKIRQAQDYTADQRARVAQQRREREGAPGASRDRPAGGDDGARH